MKRIEIENRAPDSRSEPPVPSLSIVLHDRSSLALQHVRQPALRITRRYQRTATQRAAEFQRKLYSNAAASNLGASQFQEPWLRGGLNE